jgi:hypothetical protein
VGNVELKKAFEKHVHEHDLGSDAAAFLLFQTELEERWLPKTFGWK